MKKVFIFFLTILTTFSSCSSDDNTPEQVNVTLKFTHNWDGTEVTNQDFNQFKFTNENGEEVSIERLRYLISNIKLVKFNTNEEIEIKDYHFIDLGEETGLTLNLDSKINPGSYKVSFTFGFSDADNQDGVYQDLNSVSFNVPGMLGGGYHYMQFDGKYKDSNNQEQPFNYHAIRAVDRSDPNNLIFEDTSFIVDLNYAPITLAKTQIEVEVNIAEWFKNPNTWDLNQLNTVLMPNFEAQKQISSNGESVFSLGAITLSTI